MTATVATLAGARRLYVVAGLAAFLAMLANVVDIVLGFGGEMVTYGAKPAAEWFDVFQRSPFEGLYALGILNIVYMLGMLPVFVGMLVVHRHTHPVSASFALLLSVLATGICISSNAAVPMLELAQQHAVATTDAQRWALVGSEEGKGKTILSIHGAGGGWDQGLLISAFVGEGFRVIAPSRFGYLNTLYPDDRSAVAQADAYACLLDSLGIESVSVIAFSAGGPSALQFAIRYPERTTALVMVSAISDASLVDPRPVDPSKDPVLSIMLTDFVFWTATTYFPERAMAFFGVSRAAQQRLTAEEHDRALRVLRMILPMSMRKTGNFNDPAHWFERGAFDLERIAAPTLVIHAMDDTFVPVAHGQYTAARIPNARFATQEFGGHFVYVRDAVLGEIRAFIDQYGRTP